MNKNIYPLTEEGMITQGEFIKMLSRVNLNRYTKTELCYNRETRKKEEKVYYNLPCAFDIETSSFYTGKNGETISRDEYMKLSEEEKEACEKGAIMYEWTFGIMGAVTYGRTWEEFEALREELTTRFPYKFIIYVHNLSFEFQFIRKHIEWQDVFSLSEREPVRAREVNGRFEWRDSLALTGCKLETVAEKCKKYKCAKMVGDLDYNQVRHTETELTQEELKYCENDVRIVMNYIQERIEEEGSLKNIPMTKTGYVRRDVRKHCLYTDGKNDFAYRNFIKNLTIDPEEYVDLKRAFAGGFTHANAWKAGKELRNVTSFDFTSCYPAMMVSKYYPVSKGRRVDLKTADIKQLLRTKCCLITVKLSVEEKITQEHYISSSRCYIEKAENVVVDNGRIVSGDNLLLTITELDLKIIKEAYVIKDMKILKMWVYDKGRLPRKIVDKVMEYYKGKTTLKGVEGAEEEYMRLKELLNSIYGMMVTDIIRDEIVYDGEWSKSPANLEEVLRKYNEDKKRFSFYAWGVWVTAWARLSLWTGILSVGEDYVYADTDSVKIENYEKHKAYFDKYNENIKEEMEAAMRYYGYGEEEWQPVTVKGKKKPLGYWDFEGTYSRFKTLGAKRYITDTNGDIHITIAGVNKRVGAEYLKRNGDAIKSFKEGLLFPAGESGKLTHTYIDDENVFLVTDYAGKQLRIIEKSSVHLEDASYDLSLSNEYVCFLRVYRKMFEGSL